MSAGHQPQCIRTAIVPKSSFRQPERLSRPPVDGSKFRSNGYIPREGFLLYYAVQSSTTSFQVCLNGGLDDPRMLKTWETCIINGDGPIRSCISILCARSAQKSMR